MNTILTKNQEIESLEDLIYPMSFETFANEYWGKKVLHIKRDSPEYYNSLMTIENLDEIIDHGRPKGWSLRVVKDQVPLNPNKYENEDGSINLNQIYTAYADGHSVIVHEVQRFWKPIQRLCQSIEKESNFRALGELFLTPKGKKALSPHYDAHDVFVIQLQGSKLWKLYDEEYPCPLVDSFQPIFDRETLKNKKEILLNAGDILFVPRGVPHEAVATDESSLHLSLGIHPFQWVDLMIMSLNNLAQNNIEFRRALPLGYLNNYKENQNLFSEQLEKLSKIAAQDVNPIGAVTLLHENFRSNQRTAGDGHFANLDAIDKITVDSVLCHRDYMKVNVLQTGQISRILFQGNVIKGPEYLTPCFEFIAKSGDGFKVDEIPLLGGEGKLKLVKRLIRGGLLKIKTI